ncbi:uncharacterized protein LOC111717849 [Eurytemora carolleeae]|uniref:uncharacterized protein LOC111717849 n=1 Tax=Eurytemora carolleeae TaxID=1294199 RepID=UPI000C78BF32|nr:uncharacterized protein LOC111717849 [Eurytemora carolleeae]|eukprot:XP_023349072.1 uncharacterized protein LOC111717849 [Eurytemora affinis]
MATRNKDPVSTQPQTSSLSNSGFWECPDCGSKNKSVNKACFSFECSYSVPTEAKKKKKNKSKKKGYMSKDDTCPKDHKDEARAVEKYDQVNKTRVECLIIKSGGDQNPSIKSAVQDLSSLNLEAKAQAPPISGGKDIMNPNTTRQNMKEAEVLKEQESTKNCPQSDLDGHEEPIIQSFEAEVDGENVLQAVDGIAVFNEMSNLNDECRTSCSSVASELELQTMSVKPHVKPKNQRVQRTPKEFYTKMEILDIKLKDGIPVKQLILIPETFETSARTIEFGPIGRLGVGVCSIAIKSGPFKGFQLRRYIQGI